MLLQPVDPSNLHPTDHDLALLHSTRSEAASATTDTEQQAELPQQMFPGVPSVPDELVMIAVPGEHSRKPQLAQLLQPYLPERPRCLEVCHHCWCFQD